MNQRCVRSLPKLCTDEDMGFVSTTPISIEIDYQTRLSVDEGLHDRMHDDGFAGLQHARVCAEVRSNIQQGPESVAIDVHTTRLM